MAVCARPPTASRWDSDDRNEHPSPAHARTLGPEVPSSEAHRHGWTGSGDSALLRPGAEVDDFARVSYVSDLRVVALVLAAARLGHVKRQFHSRNVRSRSAVGTVLTTTSHSLQMISAVSGWPSRINGQSVPQHSGSPKSECGRMGPSGTRITVTLRTAPDDRYKCRIRFRYHVLQIANDHGNSRCPPGVTKI